MSASSNKLNKNLLLKDIDSTIMITRENIAPSVDLAAGERKPEMKTKWSQVRNAQFNKAMGLKPESNMFYAINVNVGRVIAILEELKNFFDSEGEVNVEGLNYRSTTAMQLYYVARWYINYSKDFLLLTYTNESNNDIGSDRIAPPFTKAEIEEIENKFTLYVQFSVFFNTNSKLSVKDYLSKLPDMNLDGDNGSVIESMVKTGTAFQFPDSRETKNFFTGPGFFIASIVAQQQEQRYKSAMSEQQSINLRLLQIEQLKQQAEGTGEAGGRTLESIEKELDYVNKRLRETRKKIEKMEKKYEL